MAQRDYYEVLGVDRNASAEELKSSFRRLARQYHPDVNDAPDAEERFKEINEAYAVLSEEDKRAAYDRFGHAGVNGMGGWNWYLPWICKPSGKFSAAAWTATTASFSPATGSSTSSTKIAAAPVPIDIISSLSSPPVQFRRYPGSVAMR